MAESLNPSETPISSIRRRREAKRFGKFMVVGAIGAAVDFGSLNILLRIFNVIFPVAQAVSFSLAVTSNFTWNRFWTYPESRSKPIRKQLTQFFILNTIGLAIRTPIALALNQPFQDLIASSLNGPFAGLTRFAVETLNATLEQLGNNAAVACAVIIVMLWNFFSNRFITYSDVKFGH
jgi:putative flippase GtrA